MISSEEFVVGKHGIGWVSSDFKSAFGALAFNKRGMGTFQKLPKSMTDAQIEAELKPGICALGDVLAFCDAAPAECKDGWWNLFYLPDRVVSVRWGGGGWDVDCWDRGGGRWDAGGRVFSPATDSSDTGTLEPSDTLASALETVKAAGYRVFKEL